MINLTLSTVIKSFRYMIKKITIASRESSLAMWQAEFIKSLINEMHPSIKINIEGFKTQGDLLLNESLATIGGKGLFIKELEHALLERKADLAVHSMKDLPMDIPEEFKLIAISKREDARDAFVSNEYAALKDMPKGAVVGTSSLRRQSQIKSKYPHLIIEPLRGNLQTRLKKLDDGQYGAIILAAAGLIRLNLKSRIKQFISPSESIPAVGQGALGIEILSDNNILTDLLRPLNDEDTARCVLAERTVSRSLSGSCTVPLGAFASIIKDNFLIKGFVAKPDGSEIIHAEKSGSKSDFYKLGEALSETLIAKGAKEILANE